MIIRPGQVAHHEVALWVWQDEDKAVEPLGFPLNAVTSGNELIRMRLPRLLAGEAPGEVLQGRVLPRTQEQHTPLRAEFGIHIEGVNEGVESVLGV